MAHFFVFAIILLFFLCTEKLITGQPTLAGGVHLFIHLIDKNVYREFILNKRNFLLKKIPLSFYAFLQNNQTYKNFFNKSFIIQLLSKSHLFLKNYNKCIFSNVNLKSSHEIFICLCS